MPPRWLDATELRVGLGCMRLPPRELALETVAAAAQAGITFFDTARAYGDNEKLLTRALRHANAADTARIVTKGGMKPAAGRWIPDGRAKTIRADCEASLAALDGLEIDLYLIHAPDPATPWKTTLRALARLADDGLVKRVGVANVNLRQLDEALELAPVTAVQVALSVYDDSAVRGGVVERCEERGLAVIAHSPLGGPRRAGRLAREGLAEAALAWLLELSPAVVAIPGARTPETARSAARAARLRLSGRERSALGKARPARRAKSRAADGDVVLVMGIPGAGKSRVAEEYAARGYVRLNRDERGGTLRDIAAALDEQLSSGVRRLVLDNTYLTRASRSYAIEVAGAARGRRALHLARHAACAGAGQPRRAAARALRLAAGSRGASEARKARAGRARADLADAGVPRARAAGRRRGLHRRRARPIRTRAGGRAVRSLRSGFGSGRVRLGERHRSRRTTSDLRLAP